MFKDKLTKRIKIKFQTIERELSLTKVSEILKLPITTTQRYGLKLGYTFNRKNHDKKTKEKVLSACASSKSMAEASKRIGIPFNTFKRIAKELQCYKPNASGQGIPKPNSYITPLSEILAGKHPNYPTHKLRIRLIKEGVKEHKCEKCNRRKWMGKLIPIELDHEDGNKRNHKLYNLRILCPNCHAQTETYCGKNIASMREKRNNQQQQE